MQPVVGIRLSPSDRVRFCDPGTLCLNPGDRVEVEGFNTLLVDYVRTKGTNFILRGLRTVTDFEYEFQMAEMNRAMDHGIEYVFLPTSLACSFVSSSLVREIALLDGDISEFVHPAVVEYYRSGKT